MPLPTLFMRLSARARRARGANHHVRRARQRVERDAAASNAQQRHALPCRYGCAAAVDC